MKRIFVALMVTIALIAGCDSGAPATSSAATATGMPGTEITLPNGSYWRITPPQLAVLKRSELYLVCVDEQPTLIISTTTELYIKYNEVAQNLDKFPADKDRMIVVYCIVGITSQTASEALVAAGYTKVMHLEGGTMRWQQMGYPAYPFATAS